MNLYGYLYIGCVEVANVDRARAYVSAGLLGSSYTAPAGCDNCDHLILEPGESYTLPEFGNTPWHDPFVWASDEFLGIMPLRMDLQTVLGRTVSPRAVGGGVIGPLRMRPRVLTFTGLMLATSDRGMAYGDRWLNEVLAGARCADGCRGDDASILPSCPEEEYIPAEHAFRRLIGVGVTDGPTFSPLQNFPECKLQQVTFQLTAAESYLYGWPEHVGNEYFDGYGDSGCLSITAPTWNDTTAVVTVEAQQPLTDLHVYARRTPTDCSFTEGEVCWEAHINDLPEGGIITFDGVRREVRYYDPSLKDERSGLSLLTDIQPVSFPVAAPCSTICICGRITNGTALMSVTKVDREL